MGIAEGKRALIMGVANDKSLAWAIAQELHAQGAAIAMTYQGEILEKRVRPLAESDRCASGRRARRRQRRSNRPKSSRELKASAAVSTCWSMRSHLPTREDLRDRFLTVSRANFCQGDRDQRLFTGGPRPCGRAADGSARRRLDSHPELSRRGPRDPELQRDGCGQGGAGSLRPLSRARSRDRKISASTRSAPRPPAPSPHRPFAISIRWRTKSKNVRRSSARCGPRKSAKWRPPC